MAIGGCSGEMIAACLEIDSETVATVEGMFFDIRSKLQASDWIAHHVLRPEEQAGNAALAVRLQNAFFGGPLIATLIVKASGGIPTLYSDPLRDRAVRLHLMAERAATMAVDDPKTAMRFSKAFWRYDLAGKHLSWTSKSFARKSRTKCVATRRPKRKERPRPIGGPPTAIRKMSENRRRPSSPRRTPDAWPPSNSAPASRTPAPGSSDRSRKDSHRVQQ